MSAVATNARNSTPIASTTIAATSISPDADPRAHGGRGQVEGDGLAGDEVVGGEHRELRCRHRDQPRLSRVDLDAYVLAHHAEWERLEELTRKRRLDGRESDELVERYQRVATHLSVIRTAAPDATVITYLSLAAQPGPQPVRRRARRHLARRPHVRHRAVPGRALPAALVVARRRPRPTSWSTAVMMWWLLAPPRRRAEPALARRGRPAGQPRLRRLLQRVRRHPLRRRGLDQQRLGRGALPRPRRRSGCPVVYLLFQNIANLAIIGSIMTRHGHGAAVLGADPPARAARADRRVRGRRRRAAAVLVVGRARRPDPRASPSPARAAPPATVALGLVGVLLVSGCIEAFVTPVRLPTWARIGIGDPGRGGVPRLRVRARPPRRRAAATPGTSTPRSSRTGVAEPAS